MGIHDLTGKKFHRLSVVAFSHINRGRNACWKCQCDCGTTVIVPAAALKNGHTKSCGCFNREVRSKVALGVLKKRNTKHGHWKGNKASPEWAAWFSLKQRCLNKNNRGYKRYGGRGITVYKEWIGSFKAFLDHVGRRPGSQYSLDRIDNDRGYEPGNLRWATAKEQANNRSNNLRRP